MGELSSEPSPFIVCSFPFLSFPFLSFPRASRFFTLRQVLMTRTMSRYALALMLLLSPALVMAQDPASVDPPAEATDPAASQGLCASDPEVAQCCQQFDAMLGDINTVLSQGFTALVPVLGCLTLPPIELSSTCYNDLLSSGANCFNEMNVMLDFFNSSGLLDAALS